MQKNSNTNSVSSLIRYFDSKNNYSFPLPSSIKPIGSNLNTFQDFQQFTLPTYLSEGTETIPFLQASVVNIKAVSDPNKKIPTTLDGFIEVNELKNFDINLKRTNLTVDGKIVQKICRSDRSLCVSYAMLDDNQNVLTLSLEYPIQGPRSKTSDSTIESAYEIMINSLKLQ